MLTLLTGIILIIAVEGLVGVNREVIREFVSK